MDLDENDIARYVEGRVTEAEREEIEAHLAECPECSERVARARRILDAVTNRKAPSLRSEVRRQAESLGRNEQERRPVLSGLSNRSVAAVATVLLLVVAGILYWQVQGSASSQLRSATGEASLSVRAPADGAKVSERPVFACEEVPKALAYRITLYSEGGTVLWKGDTTAARIALPPHVPLAEGQTYLWRATVLRADGTTLRSALRTFTYAP